MSPESSDEKKGLNVRTYGTKSTMLRYIFKVEYARLAGLFCRQPTIGNRQLNH